MKVINVDLMIEMHEEISACEVCGVGGKLEVHHIFARGMGGGGRLDIPWNLIILCVDCHCKAQAGAIERRLLLGMAAEREIWRIRRDGKWRSCQAS